ncbi:MAG: hypothetical protein K5849_04395 [Bacteroidales bacterium]|nr:hypothetical protein [Bacteroidales bacterium]
MKKELAFASAALALLSCSKVALEVPGPGPDTTTQFNVDVRHPAGTSTKAVKLSWSEQDVVYVFFEGDTRNFLKMTRTGSGWNYEQKPGNIQLGHGRKLTAVYFPYKTEDPVYDAGWKFDQRFAYYLSAEEIQYDLSVDPYTEKRMVNASFLMKPCGAVVQFLIPDDNPVKGKYIMTEPGVTPTACGTIIPGGRIERVDMRPGDPMPCVTVEGEGYYFFGILDPSKRGVPDDYDFSLIEVDPKHGFAIRTATKSFQDKVLYHEENGFIWDLGVKFKTAFDTPVNYVDLGLPSGTKWATGNIEDSVITDPLLTGSYFSWMRTSYDQDISGGVDTAAELIGKDWRMPTREEFRELRDQSTWEWIESDSMAGYRITGPNGLSIFLPAVGEITNGTKAHSLESLYWTSTAGDEGMAYHLHTGEEIITHQCSCGDGLPVRPVFVR